MINAKEMKEHQGNNKSLDHDQVVEMILGRIDRALRATAADLNRVSQDHLLFTLEEDHAVVADVVEKLLDSDYTVTVIGGTILEIHW